MSVNIVLHYLMSIPPGLTREKKPHGTSTCNTTPGEQSAVLVMQSKLPTTHIIKLYFRAVRAHTYTAHTPALSQLSRLCPSFVPAGLFLACAPSLAMPGNRANVKGVRLRALPSAVAASSQKPQSLLARELPGHELEPSTLLLGSGLPIRTTHPSSIRAAPSGVQEHGQMASAWLWGDTVPYCALGVFQGRARAASAATCSYEAAAPDETRSSAQRAGPHLMLSQMA